VPRIPTLQTERLRLRPFRESDLDAYTALCADPEVIRHLGDGRPFTRDQAWRHMAMLVGHWALRSYGMWAVEEISSGAFVGRIGCHHPEGWPEFEIGWTLARPYWGMGYAYEGTVAAVQYAFMALGRDRVASFIRPDNVRSIRLAERLGERRDGEVEVAGHRVWVFALTKERWEEQRIT
jgi:RimJ/RimL family protein N-acetyltransferase